MKILILYNKRFDKSKQIRKKVETFFLRQSKLDNNKNNNIKKENGGNKQ